MAAMPRCYRHPDRETGVSCTECGRPICYECMVPAPVGQRCPEHAGRRPRSASGPLRTVRRTAARQGMVIRTDAIVTRLLVAANVLVYLITVAQGFGVNSPGGSLFNKWILYGPKSPQIFASPGYALGGGHSVAGGEWWRLITAAFLHGGLLHIAFNMWALLWLGTAVEGALGHLRFLLLYLASGLAGSAGALLWSPHTPVVGASGAIFGILGAGFILEWRATGQLAGSFMTVIVINLAITFGFSSFISAGGHVGGLIGGIVCAAIIVARSRFTQWSDVPTLVGLAGVGALAVLVAYLKVHGMAA
jgi:membrane associated rhomboid family serine protease